MNKGETAGPGELEELQTKLCRIKAWTEAYPLNVFPEPDLKRAAKVLRENGMTLDSISASSIRHVLSHIKEIIEGAAETKLSDFRKSRERHANTPYYKTHRKGKFKRKARTPHRRKH